MTEVRQDKEEKWIRLPNGAQMLRFWNDEIGGYTYMTDEVGDGITAWNTAMIDASTLRTALEDYEDLHG